MGGAISSALVLPALPSVYTTEGLAHQGVRVDFIDSIGKNGHKVMVAECSKAGNGPALLFSHGNAEDLHTIFAFDLYIARPLQGWALSYEYSGYGPYAVAADKTEVNLLDDAQTAALWAAKYVPGQRDLVVYGRSIGCAMAVASANVLGARCSLLVLQSPPQDSQIEGTVTVDLSFFCPLKIACFGYLWEHEV